MTAEDFKNNLLPLKNKMFRLACRLLSNRQEAEDVVQETYLKIWNMRNDLAKYKNVDGLLMTMTRNLCLDMLKTKKNKFASLNSKMRVSDTANPYKQSETANNLQLVQQILNNLPEQQKTIIQLRDVEGYEFEEIMQATGLDLNYVRVNLSRGRKKIREEIQKIHSYETR